MMKKFFYNWMPVLIWSGLIFYFSAQPGLNSGMAVFWDVFLRKLAHAFEFAFLNFLIFRAILNYEYGYKKAIFWALILAIIYAASDEFHQYFVPLRQAKIKDVFVDSLGIIFSSFFQIYFYQKKESGK